MSRNIVISAHTCNRSVTSREGRVSRNSGILDYFERWERSRPARDVRVEIARAVLSLHLKIVTSREGRVSRNIHLFLPGNIITVTSREGRVSRNWQRDASSKMRHLVTSREGRVSRNLFSRPDRRREGGHVPRGTCE